MKIELNLVYILQLYSIWIYKIYNNMLKLIIEIRIINIRL